jgi:hypothetical protein
MATINSQTNNFAPVPLSQTTAGTTAVQFPSDLLSYHPTQQQTSSGATVSTGNSTGITTASNGFYTFIQFVPASTYFQSLTAQIGATGASGGVSSSGVVTPQPTGVYCYLPLPLQIHDIEAALWQDSSWLDFLPPLMQQILLHGRFVLPDLGLGAQAVNPFLYMLYKQPLFREFTFNWVLAPNNPQDSQNLVQILTAFKTAALPQYTPSTRGGTLDYPYLAYISLNPNQYLFDFKPCVIVSVQIDFSGSGHGPSFFNDGSPTIVSLSVHFKEIEILVRSDVLGRGGNLTANMGQAPS